ncbi:DUF2510 domain-containing protein [Nocardia sp. NPDC050630]|uniref:DUF2510 domain-containing protein n=1 Tax=Nocardia sp. NPDC050630 TaxID=3364321 RepID=UPI0037B12124
MIALFVVLLVIGTLAKSDDTDQAAPTPTTAAATSAIATTPNSTTAPAAPPVPTTEAAPAPTAPRPASDSDPRCAPAAAGAVEKVQAGLTHSGWRLTNGTVIDSGGKTYLGATIVDGSGATKERSDVWVIANGAVYASTGGARNSTMFPKASAAPLNVSPGDDVVQAVDRCVVNKTLGR